MRVRRVWAQEMSMLDTPRMDSSSVSQSPIFVEISATFCVLAKIMGPVI